MKSDEQSIGPKYSIDALWHDNIFYSHSVNAGVRLFTRATLSRYLNDSRKNYRRICGDVPIGA